MEKISIIDIEVLVHADRSASHYQKAATDFARACTDTGFVVVTGHGISSATIASVRDNVIALFARPMSEKLALRVSKDNYRGYIPLGFFTPNAKGAADVYEGYKLHQQTASTDPICADCVLYGPNKWPQFPSTLRPAVESYWQTCDELARILLAALATSLKLPFDYFQPCFDKSLSNMTLLHYPPQTAEQTGFGIHPHKDTDVLTLLSPDPVGGLQVKSRRSDAWINVDAPADALVMNIGDMLEIWSGGRFVSTPHRVINQSGQERFSFPYFFVPRHDVVVTPVVKEYSPGFEHREISVGAASQAIWSSNWPDAEAVDVNLDPAVTD